MDIWPELGDIWFPKKEAKFATPPFIILEVRKSTSDAANYYKVLILESRIWFWYGVPSIVKDYYLVGRI